VIHGKFGGEEKGGGGWGWGGGKLFSFGTSASAARRSLRGRLRGDGLLPEAIRTRRTPRYCRKRATDRNNQRAESGKEEKGREKGKAGNAYADVQKNGTCPGGFVYENKKSTPATPLGRGGREKEVGIRHLRSRDRGQLYNLAPGHLECMIVKFGNLCGKL